MMCRLRRILAALLCAGWLILLMPISVFAAEGELGNGVQWSFDSTSGTLTITGNGDMPHFAYYNEYPWDAYIDQITKVCIADGITSVGNDTFYKHEALETVQFPDGLLTIGEGAFKYCDKLTDLTLPGSLKTIEDEAFYGCDTLSKIIIPNAVTYIGDHAFASGPVTDPESELYIPASVTKIDTSAFVDRKFAKVCVDKGNPNYYTDEDGVLFGREQAELILSPMEMSGTYVVPEGTRVIRYCAFARTNSTIEEVVLPSSLRTIDDYAFSGSRIRRIKIPDTVESLGKGAFFECMGLDEIILPSTITHIPESLFLRTYLHNIDIPESVVSIGDSAFSHTSLEAVFIPKNVEQISDSAFYSCGEKLTFHVDPENPYYCTTERGILMSKADSSLVVAPEGVEGILVVSPSIKKIESLAFYGSSLSVIAINCDTFSIGGSSFQHSKLQKIYLGKGLSFIDGDDYNNPFDDCEQLTDIYYGGSEEDWVRIQAEDLKEFPENVKIHYNVSYSEFRSRVDMPQIKENTTAETIWPIVIIGCAVAIPGIYLWIVKHKGKNQKEGA